MNSHSRLSAKGTKSWMTARPAWARVRISLAGAGCCGFLDVLRFAAEAGGTVVCVLTVELQGYSSINHDIGSWRL
jgi:hypothetical protein